MNAGKSTLLLQASHNYQERGMNTYLITAQLDNRAGEGQIGSRIGINASADTFTVDDDLFFKIKLKLSKEKIACILIDEAQFLTSIQVWQLARVVDDLQIPVLCYGLRVDFQGELFPGSLVLLSIADEMREIKTICHCGRKATMVLRLNAKGEVVSDGTQIEIGGEEKYVSVCRKHFIEKNIG